LHCFVVARSKKEDKSDGAVCREKLVVAMGQLLECAGHCVTQPVIGKLLTAALKDDDCDFPNCNLPHGDVAVAVNSNTGNLHALKLASAAHFQPRKARALNKRASPGAAAYDALRQQSQEFCGAPDCFSPEHDEACDSAPHPGPRPH